MAQYNSLVLSNPAQGLYSRVRSKHSLISCGVTGGTIFALNLRAGLKKLGRVFPQPEHSTCVGLGSFIGGWTSLPSFHKRLILFTLIFPQEHRDLKSSLITVHVTRLDPQKGNKVGLDWGLICTWIGHGARAGPKPRMKCYQQVPLTAFITIMCMTITLNTPINMDYHLELHIAKNNYRDYKLLTPIRQTTTWIVLNIVDHINNKESTLRTLRIILWVHVMIFPSIFACFFTSKQSIL